uniref:Uncharacterized protein n=1 Tax=Haptolina ericina TaxID=156174 RepID=A0A7S3ET47_9EUKA|mmetsp:Transcript_20766/g.46470  ORF Transcript_20766/g.46470 Transcript_20766/m.46470 type:complete len:208 (+) Transcript_20766:152-775(+)
MELHALSRITRMPRLLGDQGFSDYTIAITRVVRMLTAPPPASDSEGPKARAAGMGTELMYYWSTLVVRLCFGSFIVAILVGAFNKVMASEASEKADTERDSSLPDGFVDASDRSTSSRTNFILGYLLIGKVPGGVTAAGVCKVLMEEVAVVEACNPEMGSKQVMIEGGKLSDLFGEEPARQLLRAYGAARDTDREEAKPKDIEMYTC